MKLKKKIIIIFHKTKQDEVDDQILKQNPAKIQIIDKLYCFNGINTSACMRTK